MRWTKGKPAAKAPFGEVVLGAFDPTPEEREFGRKTYYRTVLRRQGPRVNGEATAYFVGWPSEQSLMRQPDRYWELPK
jgi:hypothetical protein